MVVLKKSRIAQNVDQIIIESDQCQLFRRSRRAFVGRCGKPLICTLYYESPGRASPPTEVIIITILLILDIIIIIIIIIINLLLLLLLQNMFVTTCDVHKPP